MYPHIVFGSVQKTILISTVVNSLAMKGVINLSAVAIRRGVFVAVKKIYDLEGWLSYPESNIAIKREVVLTAQKVVQQRYHVLNQMYVV